MAFTKEEGSTTNNKPKANGFINIWLPTRDGGRSKVGVIYLTDNDKDPKQKALREWLEEDPENRIETLKDRFEMDYQKNQPKTDSFDLGEDDIDHHQV